MDKDKIGIFGHSFGAATSLLTLAKDRRFKYVHIPNTHCACFINLFVVLAPPVAFPMNKSI